MRLLLLSLLFVYLLIVNIGPNTPYGNRLINILQIIN